MKKAPRLKLHKDTIRELETFGAGEVQAQGAKTAKGGTCVPGCASITYFCCPTIAC